MADELQHRVSVKRKREHSEDSTDDEELRKPVKRRRKGHSNLSTAAKLRRYAVRKQNQARKARAKDAAAAGTLQAKRKVVQLGAAITFLDFLVHGMQSMYLDPSSTIAWSRVAALAASSFIDTVAPVVILQAAFKDIVAIRSQPIEEAFQWLAKEEDGIATLVRLCQSDDTTILAIVTWLVGVLRKERTWGGGTSTAVGDEDDLE